MKWLFIKVVVVVAFVSAGFLLVGDFVDAQNYGIHEQIPGQAGQSGIIDGVDYGEAGVDTLQDYLESAYKFGIAIVAILAVVMIGVGGFMYIVTSAGNAGKLANAKEIITSAILGLVMALLSWLILFVINPDLVSNTLQGVEFDMYNTTWKNDHNADPTICNVEGKELYEVRECSGDYVCIQDTCRNKKSFFTFGSVKFPGVCSESDSISSREGSECGVATGSGAGLSGICQAGGDCQDGWIELNTGEPCYGNTTCCTRGL